MPLDPDFAALAQPVAAAAAIPQSAGGSLDPDFAALASPPQAKTAQAAPLLGPWASALVRPIIKTASSAPYMAADAGVALGNILSGRVPLRNPDGSLNWQGNMPASAGGLALPSQGLNQSLDSTTTAPTGIGKVAEFLSTALLSAKLPGMPTSAGPSAAATSRLTASQQQALSAGEGLGMRVTPGARSGSVPLQQMEAKLESQPLTSGPFAAIKSGNQTALNNTAARSIGEAANVVDSTVMGRAADRLGSTFENVRNPKSIVYVDPEAEAAHLEQLEQNYSGLIPQTIASHPLVSQFSKLMQNGGANLEQLGQLSSKLGKAAYKQMTSQGGDRDMGQALYDVKNHVDDLVQSGLSGEDAAIYAAARNQWRNLSLLTKPGVVNSSSGNVSGLNLANMLARTDKAGFLYGHNTSDLYQAARFAQAFRPLVGDSGTATRSSGTLFSTLASMAGAGLGAGGAHAAGHGAEMGAGLGAIALPAALNIASRFYLSPVGNAFARGAITLPGAAQRALPPATVAGLLASQ